MWNVLRRMAAKPRLIATKILTQTLPLCTMNEQQQQKTLCAVWMEVVKTRQLYVKWARARVRRHYTHAVYIKYHSASQRKLHSTHISLNAFEISTAPTATAITKTVHTPHRFKYTEIYNLATSIRKISCRVMYVNHEPRSTHFRFE